MENKNTSLCNYCNEIDDILLFFLYCSNTKTLWDKVLDWWNKNNEMKTDKYSWDIRECILFGFQLEPIGNDFDALSFVVMICKKYIYVKKMRQDNRLFLCSFLSYLKYHDFYELESYILYGINCSILENLYNIL